MTVDETLAYSWLKQIKKCQIIHGKWKISEEWTSFHSHEIETLRSKIDQKFKQDRDYFIFGNGSIESDLKQGESDVVGIKIEDNAHKVYALDIAYHSTNGLDYKSNKTYLSNNKKMGKEDFNIMKIIQKSARTAFYIYNFLNINSAEIYFATPHISDAWKDNLNDQVKVLSDIFNKAGFGLSFKFEVKYNESFFKDILEPLINLKNPKIDDDEIFLRAYQLIEDYNVFKVKNAIKCPGKNCGKNINPDFNFCPYCATKLK